MKILYVITGLGVGGAEKVVCDLADRMHDNGHQVKIAYMKGVNVLVNPMSKDIEVIYLGFETAASFISASIKYRILIQDFKPDIVHAHMVHANIFARLNRLGLSIPKLICTAHNANEGGWLRMLGYQITNGLSDLNTNVSVEAVESFVKKRAFNRSAIAVYNGIDLNKFKFLAHDYMNESNKYKNILAVGRLNHQKDYPNLLKALSMIKSKGYLFNLSIVGDGEQRNHIIGLISYYGLDNYVKLLGRRDDIPDLMSRADIFVLASAFEGFGLVVAEAMACNTFVVGTDCGGVKEVMGDTGILVPPRDSVALAEALIEAMNMSKEHIIQNNIKAIDYIKENFDLKDIVAKWIELYEN